VSDQKLILECLGRLWTYWQKLDQAGKNLQQTKCSGLLVTIVNYVR